MIQYSPVEKTCLFHSSMSVDIRARSPRLYYLLLSFPAGFGPAGSNPPGGLLLGYSTAAIGWVTPGPVHEDMSVVAILSMDFKIYFGFFESIFCRNFVQEELFFVFSTSFS